MPLIYFHTVYKFDIAGKWIQGLLSELVHHANSFGTPSTRARIVNCIIRNHDQSWSSRLDPSSTKNHQLEDGSGLVNSVKKAYVGGVHHCKS